MVNSAANQAMKHLHTCKKDAQMCYTAYMLITEIFLKKYIPPMNHDSEVDVACLC